MSHGKLGKLPNGINDNNWHISGRNRKPFGNSNIDQNSFDLKIFGDNILKYIMPERISKSKKIISLNCSKRRAKKLTENMFS